MFFDVVDHLFWHQIANGHVSSSKQSNLGRADVVLYKLLDDPDVISVGLQGRKSLVDVRARALRLLLVREREGVVHSGIVKTNLDNESAKVAQDVINILVGPHARRAHGLNQICSCKQSNVTLLLADRCFHSANHFVDLVVKVVQDLGSLQVFAVQSLPRVDTDPAALFHGQCAHVDSVLCLDQTRLLVSIAHTGQICADDFELRVKARIVGGHFEHAEMEEGDGREGATGDQDQRSAV